MSQQVSVRGACIWEIILLVEHFSRKSLLLSTPRDESQEPSLQFSTIPSSRTLSSVCSPYVCLPTFLNTTALALVKLSQSYDASLRQLMTRRTRSADAHATVLIPGVQTIFCDVHHVVVASSDRANAQASIIAYAQCILPSHSKVALESPTQSRL